MKTCDTIICFPTHHSKSNGCSDTTDTLPTVCATKEKRLDTIAVPEILTNTKVVFEPTSLPDYVFVKDMYKTRNFLCR